MYSVHTHYYFFDHSRGGLVCFVVCLLFINLKYYLFIILRATLGSDKQKDKGFFCHFLSVFRRYETQDHSIRTPENVYILNGRCERGYFMKYTTFFKKKNKVVTTVYELLVVLNPKLIVLTEIVFTHLKAVIQQISLADNGIIVFCEEAVQILITVSVQL